MKPLIGIIEWPYTDKDGDYIFEVSGNISNKIIEAGGIPIGIFPTKSEDYINKNNNEIGNMNTIESEDLLNTLDMVDGIIKPGALIIYNYEKFIHRYTIDRNMPYLGICAGMQLMCNTNEPILNHHNVEHKIRIYRGTLLADILKREEITVISKHRRKVILKDDYKVSAMSYDGVIEAIEDSNCNFNLGVQWHPELDNSDSTDRLFKGLVESAKVYRKMK